MNKKVFKYLKYLIIGLLIIFNIYSTLILKLKENEIVNNKNEYNIQLTNTYKVIDSYKNTIEYKFNIADFTKLIFKKNDSIVLIYRYFNNECYSCIIEDLEILKKVKKINSKKFYIIHSTLNESENEVIKTNSFFEKYNHFSLSDSVLKLKQHIDLHPRFFAILNRKGTMSSIFFPNTQSSDLTSSYLIQISNTLGK